MGYHTNPQFLYLTTKGWKTGKQHKIEIWFVEYDGRYYVMAETLEKAHWVQNIMHDPKVLFTVKHNTVEGTARIVDKSKEPKLSSEISKLMSAKEVDGLIIELKHQ
jgi:deazaflavin-dependent oxidoreductase (nitroreductase family)